jgi:hypothetical protein
LISPLALPSSLLFLSLLPSALSLLPQPFDMVAEPPASFFTQSGRPGRRSAAATTSYRLRSVEEQEEDVGEEDSEGSEEEEGSGESEESDDSKEYGADEQEDEDENDY